MPKSLLYKELSYKVVGILFEIYNELGGGYQEKYYQKAIALRFKREGILFQQEVLVPLKFQNETIGRYFIDFVIEGKIALEIKAVREFKPRDIKQVIAYLQATGLELGILASFTRKGVIFRRILRGYE